MNPTPILLFSCSELVDGLQVGYGIRVTVIIFKYSYLLIFAIEFSDIFWRG